jgi:predicted  nucleic acid-binding Zn-ribbon protein
MNEDLKMLKERAKVLEQELSDLEDDVRIITNELEDIYFQIDSLEENI